MFFVAEQLSYFFEINRSLLLVFLRDFKFLLVALWGIGWIWSFSICEGRLALFGFLQLEQYFTDELGALIIVLDLERRSDFVQLYKCCRLEAFWGIEVVSLIVRHAISCRFSGTCVGTSWLLELISLWIIRLRDVGIQKWNRFKRSLLFHNVVVWLIFLWELKGALEATAACFSVMLHFSFKFS